jgi:Zn ribbon nucleic-acid-binding protein
MICEHIKEAGSPDPQTREGCQDCLAEGRHDWVHLRLCLECGHVGCCDSSPARHASAHGRSDSHPVIQSFEPGETWKWCLVDETLG